MIRSRRRRRRKGRRLGGGGRVGEIERRIRERGRKRKRLDGSQ